MGKLDIFHYRFGKIDEFGWWDLEIISADVGGPEQILNLSCLAYVIIFRAPGN